MHTGFTRFESRPSYCQNAQCIRPYSCRSVFYSCTNVLSSTIETSDISRSILARPTPNFLLTYPWALDDTHMGSTRVPYWNMGHIWALWLRQLSLTFRQTFTSGKKLVFIARHGYQISIFLTFCSTPTPDGRRQYICKHTRKLFVVRRCSGWLAAT